LIVGYSATTTATVAGYMRAFYMTYGGTMTDFNPYHIVYDSSAYAVNDLGTIVGTSNQASCVVFPPFNFVHVCRGTYSYPVIFNTNGTITQIGNLGGNGGAALAVNNAGDVVGWNLTASGDRHAFLYTGGQTYDLNSLMPPLFKNYTITEASGINDSGMIVAHANSLLAGDVIVVLAP
jgi:probable HAF family extracellular repeat protein